MKKVIANINIFFFWFSKIWQNFGAFHWNINFFLLNIHKNELCFSSSGRPNLKGQVCKLASRNGNFFPRLIFCSLKQKVAALLHFTVPLCFCVEVVGATIIYKSWELGFLIIYLFIFSKLSSLSWRRRRNRNRCCCMCAKYDRNYFGQICHIFWRSVFTQRIIVFTDHKTTKLYVFSAPTTLHST